MRVGTIVCACLIAGLGEASPRKLSDVFDVNMAEFDHFSDESDDPNHGSRHGSCKRPYNNARWPANTEPHLNSEADFNSRDNILNNIWYQIYHMNYQARVALGSTNLKTYLEAQKLIWSFWGIWWTNIWSASNPDGPMQPRGQRLTKLKAIRGETIF